ncbi:MAG: YHS domain-containing protein [Pedobacter sp.]|nr:MAG: YHS domain-containing protein [Pedobacter sp.]
MINKVIFVALLSATLNLAANPITNKMQDEKTEKLKKSGTDPVCKMKVKAGITKTVMHEKKQFGFCSEGCKKKFVENPGKYLKS